MKFDDIFDMWEKDAHIDETELGAENRKIPELHHKYYKIFVGEQMQLEKLRAELKQLILTKHTFYTQGPSEESKKLGWKFPAKGMILKNEVQMYLDADQDIIDLSLRISMQKEKVDALESIIKSLKDRGYLIRQNQDWLKWIAGG